MNKKMLPFVVHMLSLLLFQNNQ